MCDSERVQYEQEFEDKTIILFILTKSTTFQKDQYKREIFKNLQGRDNISTEMSYCLALVQP